MNSIESSSSNVSLTADEKAKAFNVEVAPGEKFNREKVNRLLAVCSKCANSKLVVWDDSAELKYTKQHFKMASDESKVSKKFSVLVRCAWLKQPVELPMKIIICDGSRPIGDRNETEY